MCFFVLPWYRWWDPGRPTAWGWPRGRSHPEAAVFRRPWEVRRPRSSRRPAEGLRRSSPLRVPTNTLRKKSPKSLFSFSHLHDRGSIFSPFLTNFSLPHIGVRGFNDGDDVAVERVGRVATTAKNSTSSNVIFFLAQDEDKTSQGGFIDTRLPFSEIICYGFFSETRVEVLVSAWKEKENLFCFLKLQTVFRQMEGSAMMPNFNYDERRKMGRQQNRLHQLANRKSFEGSAPLPLSPKLGYSAITLIHFLPLSPLSLSVSGTPSYSLSLSSRNSWSH